MEKTFTKDTKLQKGAKFIQDKNKGEKGQKVKK